MLMPAAILIMVALAAIAVDLSIAFLGQRELANASVAAANDAATLALSNPAFYGGGKVETDPARVEREAEARVRNSLDPARHHGLVVEAEAIPPRGAGCTWTVRVRASATVDYVFSKAIPGGPDQARVQAVAEASPRQGESTC